jgi:hypothetical protein
VHLPQRQEFRLFLDRDHRQPQGYHIQRPLRERGMPDFTGKLTEADVVKIQAFIQGTADAIWPN